MDRGAWEAAVHGVTTSQTQLSNFTFLSFLISPSHSLELCVQLSVFTWESAVHGVTTSQTQLSNFTFLSFLISPSHSLELCIQLSVFTFLPCL